MQPKRSPQKRKRGEKSGSSSAPAELLAAVEASSPQPSTEVVGRVAPRSLSPIPPEDLPGCRSTPLNLQPSAAPLLDDGPLLIHNYSVEEYQRIYAEVVEDMLRSVEKEAGLL